MNQGKDLSQLEKKLGIKFKDKQLLKVALTHRSWVNENKHEKRQHNERIEFLGDAVLELVITEFLYNKFPKEPEGKLTAYRAALVNTQALANIAKRLGINDFLYLSKGESKGESRAREHILANTLEAIIGAIYILYGYQVAKDFILKNIANRIDEVVQKKLYLDPKSALQEAAQEKVGITPSYEVIKEEGPDHNKTFTVKVILKQRELAQGKGKNKQEAERAAARRALEEQGWL